MAAAIVDGVELKGCPHCGSPATLKTDDKPHNQAWFWVKCDSKTCGASQPSQRTEEDAASRWNQRA